jgi:hypothetical protein
VAKRSRTRQPKPESTTQGSEPEALAWARTFLPEYFSDQPADFHRELFADLADPPRRLITRVAPRGHAKSTCAAFAYPLWCLCTQRKRNIVILTHETSLSTQFVRDIRSELESNELILKTYGDLCTAVADDDPPSKSTTKSTKSSKRKSTKKRSRGSWSQAKFTASNAVTVQAKGAGSSFRGVRVGPTRPDLIICDDIEKDELVATEEGRRKLEHWLRRVVMPALAPDGQLVVLGSIIHHDSLLANLRDRQKFPRWDYRVYRAIECPADADGVHHRQALWPSRWPLHRLDEERDRIGTLAFEQEYQANPIDDSIRIFRPEWLRRYDPAEIEHRPLINLIAVDPATGASGGDFFALWVGSIDPDTGLIYTRQLTLERIGIVQQVKRILATFDEWRPVKIGIETTAYQVVLKQILDEISMKERRYLPIVAVQTLSNKRARIEGASPFFENGTFRLPPTLDPEAERQFLEFPKARHDDAPDVCAMGIELARGLRAAGSLGAVLKATGVTGCQW